MNNYELQADSFNRWFEEYDRRNREAYDAHAIAKYHKVVNRVFGTLIAIFSVLYMFVACPAPLEVMLVGLFRGMIIGGAAVGAILFVSLSLYAWYRWAFDKD